MNVVGKVGNLISQGVYSVATPFHPFGGAVDIIVVQQQDGTFRSTPWYVRFGKFQGVLKGAEKIVRISVNGVEADFHMCLDNSGEAYFLREVGAGKGSETNDVIKDSISDKNDGEDNGHSDTSLVRNEKAVVSISRFESSISDSAVINLHEEHSSDVGLLDRAESDSGRRYYEFPDELAPHAGSTELSEFGSNRYESLEGVDHQDSDSEVILFSVDGHVLTAPVSSLEENKNTTENVQLCTPQFHLGPGKGTNICNGNGDFSTVEDDWSANYISELHTPTCNAVSENLNNGVLDHRVVVCEGREALSPQSQEIEERDPHLCSSSESAATMVKRTDIFKSCLELSELSTHTVQGNFQDLVSPVSAVTDGSEDTAPPNLTETGIIEDDIVINGGGPSLYNFESPPNDVPQDIHLEGKFIDEAAQGRQCMWSDSSVSNDPEWIEEQFATAQVVDRTESSLYNPTPERACGTTETVEPQTSTSNEGIQTDISIGFAISLCGNKLHGGMGSSAAAEAFDAHRISEEEFKLSAASIIKNGNLIVRYREKYLRWEKAAQIVLGMAAFDLELPIEDSDVIPVEQVDTQNKSPEVDSGITPTPSGRRWRLWPIPFRRVRTLEPSNSISSNEEVFVDSESSLHNSQAEQTSVSPSVNGTQHLKTHIPTIEQIASLNLREGQNMITFSFSTRVLGTQQVDAHIYLWKWNARIVISDVDGTITKSDVLGQFMPLVGRDWTQSGVAHLFSAIKENGYQLLFLSARAIVQAYLTRSFLLNLKQDGTALPNGPVVISPDGLFPSLFREVIRRAPHEFKIACLEDIKALFPADYNPFYAGFGNRDTDELSYRKIGIPKGKIFIINPKGEVAINNRIDVKSYTSLHTLVDDMFPPTSLVEQEDFNSWNFWRMPLPDINI